MRFCGHPVRRFGSIGLLMLAGFTGRAAELPPGRILEPVACAADATQTYALYVPASYDRARRWPVLFCFDPAARGRVPVERFQAAAEKFGYVVAGSDNSRNGEWAGNATAINAMINDVNRRLAIDSRRIYVAGLSGGARVACQVALTGLAQGVIACSAAFANSETPAKVPFVFFGTAGLNDFNYLELRRTDRDLDVRHAPHRVVIFPGGHEWLPPELAVEAVGWLELQAMRSGLRPRDEAWIAAQFEARHAAVPAQPPGENYLALKSLAGDFKDLADTAALEQRVAALAASREIRDWTKAERSRENCERELNDRLASAVQEGMAGSVRKQADELRAKANAPEDSPDRQMATRVLQGIQIYCMETTRELLRAENYEAAEPLLAMAAILRPDRPQTYFDLARARAHLRDKKGTLEALQQAAAAGFKDAARVEADQVFAPLRKEPAYQAAVAAMK